MGGKERHGCFLAWLILMLIANSLTVLIYSIFLVANFMGIILLSQLPIKVTLLHIVMLIFATGANVIFTIALFKWKKWGFWGFAAMGVIAFAINLNIGIGLIQCFLGLAGIAVLYGVMQIEKNRVSAWQNLE